MGNIGWSGIIIVAVLVVLLFGRGKISSIMGDVAKGIKSFKKGLSDDNTEENKTINTEGQSSAEGQSSKEDSNLENK
jgi:sec-independent protein translocase protein TatA|tara:strand:+ start:359 stop:589 length:231 start_codon:yes stop_codon:yes gene_type:complete